MTTLPKHLNKPNPKQERERTSSQLQFDTHLVFSSLKTTYKQAKKLDKNTKNTTKTKTTELTQKITKIHQIKYKNNIDMEGINYTDNSL